MRFSSSLILLGIFLLMYSSYLTYQRVNPWRLSFSSYKNVEQVEKSNLFNIPAEIIVADLKIDLPIRKAKNQKGKYQAFDDAVSHLSSSPIPGEKGNSILYAHNWSNLFGRLTKAKIGQKVIIKFKDRSQKEFRVKYIQEVKPDQIAVLNPSQDSRITLYTCSGFLDSKRFVVVATLN